MSFTRPARLPTALVMAIATVIMASSTAAQTYQWINQEPSNADWNDAANWDAVGDFPQTPGSVATMSNLTFESSGSIRFAGDFNNSTVGTLNVDLADGQTLQFTGSAAGRSLTFVGVDNDPVALNKSGLGELRVNRRLVFNSVATINVTGGMIDFSVDDTLRGNSDINFEGSGGYTLISGESGTEFSGNAIIANHGTVVVNGGLVQHSSVAGTTVTIANTGTLRGTGTIGRATTVQSGGTLAPGESPGVMTFDSDLTLEAGSQFDFQLVTNSTADRGYNFSGIDMGAAAVLDIDPGAEFNLLFSEGDVDFTNSFWETNQSWLVLDASVAPLIGPNIFTLGTVSNDSLNQSFDITGGELSFLEINNSIYLQYVIPEPATTAFTFALVVSLVLLLRRRRA